MTFLNKCRFILIGTFVALLAACGGGEPAAEVVAPAPTTAVEAVIEDGVDETTTEVVKQEEAVTEENSAEEPASTNAQTDWTSAWIMNETGETSPIFDGVVVNVQSVEIQIINGKEYQCITASGIPNYETVIDQTIIDNLNNRQKASIEFTDGTAPLAVGDLVVFGGDVGYRPAMGCTEGQDGAGYWPPGPACPIEQNKSQCFPLNPEPATEVCEGGLNDIGTWVNGVSIFNWQDGQSYNGQGVWQNEAAHFEWNDLDIVPGHSANGNYHHHSNPFALGEQLGDNGDGHSPIYGFAADGYPVYGPWHDAGVLANSCWKTRDYDNPDSDTGCDVAGERSCLLVDQYDISKGTIPADSNGPSTSDIVTSMSGNDFVTTSGYYLQDYYYDSTCSDQGIVYLDEYNGHDHDGLGYHYHVSLEEQADGSLTDVFPFYIGPRYAGTLQDNAIASCSTGEVMGPPPGGDGEGGGGQNGPPDLSGVAEALGITEQDLLSALGGPPPDMDAAAATLGITVEELRAAFDAAGVQAP